MPCKARVEFPNLAATLAHQLPIAKSVAFFGEVA
jgi:hypothetical protein